MGTLNTIPVTCMRNVFGCLDNVGKCVKSGRVGEHETYYFRNIRNSRAEIKRWLSQSNHHTDSTPPDGHLWRRRVGGRGVRRWVGGGDCVYVCVCVCSCVCVCVHVYVYVCMYGGGGQGGPGQGEQGRPGGGRRVWRRWCGASARRAAGGRTGRGDPQHAHAAHGDGLKS